MSTKKWIVTSAIVGTIAAATAYAFINPIQVFRTTTLFLGVSQGTSLTQKPQYEYTEFDGSNLVALALGAPPSSNQLFAMSIDCGSGSAFLVGYDKLTSNSQTIASCSNLQIVQNQSLKSKFVDSERFVGEFIVATNGNLVGGTLMLAGRLHLGTNGCPKAVLISLDKDSEDKTYGDTDVPDTDQDAKVKDLYRAGQAHMVGSFNMISGNRTNTVLVPLGHLTFRRELDSYDIAF